MPVYWGDLWNDTRDLNAVEQCAYYNLLGSMWMEGGSLPNDNERLQRMSRVTEKEWRAVNATVTGYFTLKDGRLYQKRLSEEYAKAMKAYTARSEHIASVNSKRRQSPSTVTVTQTVHTTHNSHSPNGEHPPSEDGAKRPRQPKGTRLEIHWKPCPEIFDYGANLNLTRDETDAICRAFKDYFLSPDATRPVKKDWYGACKRWISREAPRTVADRARRQRSVGNAGVRQSLTAATHRILAKAGIRPQPDEQRAGEVHAHGGRGAEGIAAGEGHSGPVIDADDWRRMPESSEGTEGHDEADAGHDGRLGSPARGVSETLGGLPGGRGEESADFAGRSEPVVALMVGTERAAGDVHEEAPDDADGLAIPAFLRRA